MSISVLSFEKNTVAARIIHVFIGKAPSAPSGPPDDEADIRLENRTSGLWKVKAEGKNGIFPAQIPAGESMLVTVGAKQAPCNVTYVIELQNETFEFQLKLAKSEGRHEMIVDWMNLANVTDVELKPASSSSNQPVKLGNEEMIISIKK